MNEAPATSRNNRTYRQEEASQQWGAQETLAAACDAGGLFHTEQYSPSIYEAGSFG